MKTNETKVATALTYDEFAGTMEKSVSQTAKGVVLSRVIKKPSKQLVQIVLITTLIALITLLHYITSVGKPVEHELYRKFYYLPIILSGLFFSLRGGLGASLLISSLYLPHVILHWQTSLASVVDRCLEIGLFIVVGTLVGAVVGRERKQRQQAQQAERLALIGQTASTMAHEIKNPLTVIGGYAQLINRAFDQNAASKISSQFIPEAASIIVNEVKRLEHLVHGALSYAKPANLEKKEHHIIDLIKPTLQLVKQQADESGVKIVLDANLKQQSVLLDGEKIHQVLLNLLENGLAFTPKGGQITVKAFSDPKWITIEVADTGPGIPPELLDSVFNPFVSARKDGTGLGLAIAKRIIADHGGEIWGQNLEQGGALFGFKIPLD
ncbi:MAG: sensor histidine kinase [Planctomycetota bacterium]|jgi:signal transduction histidine kinase